MSQPGNRPSPLTYGLTALWLLCLCVYILTGTGIVPFHGDESTQIYMGRDFYYQFVEGDMAQVRYSASPLSPTEQDLRLLNGTIPKYLFGLAAWTGGYNIDDINDQWDWGADWTYNTQNGHMPSDDLLWRARLMSAIFLAAGVPVIFWIARILYSLPAAFIASVLYTLHPVLLLNGRRAMMEGGLIFFSLLVVLFGLWLLRERRFHHYLLMGLAAGLALASKHTAAFTVVAVFAACLVIPLWQQRQNRADTLHHLGSIMVTSILTLLLFYVLNPAWWGDPLSRAGLVLERRNDLLAGQVAFFGGYDSLLARFQGWWNQVFVAQPAYYETEGWSGPLRDSIHTYETSGLSGIVMGGSTAGAILLLILTLAGIWRLRNAPAQVTGAGWMMLMWTGMMAGLTLFLTPIGWQRYYLPIYPVIILLTAGGAVSIFKTGQRLWQTTQQT